jgi:hypothetical protein
MPRRDCDLSNPAWKQLAGRQPRQVLTTCKHNYRLITLNPTAILCQYINFSYAWQSIHRQPLTMMSLGACTKQKQRAVLRGMEMTPPRSHIYCIFWSTARPRPTRPLDQTTRLALPPPRSLHIVASLVPRAYPPRHSSFRPSYTRRVYLHQASANYRPRLYGTTAVRR